MLTRNVTVTYSLRPVFLYFIADMYGSGTIFVESRIIHLFLLYCFFVLCWVSMSFVCGHRHGMKNIYGGICCAVTFAERVDVGLLRWHRTGSYTRYTYTRAGTMRLRLPAFVLCTPFASQPNVSYGSLLMLVFLHLQIENENRHTLIWISEDSLNLFLVLNELFFFLYFCSVFFCYCR